ncbi:MAG: SDR family oxidoreductase [SAR324 cluster bacterium]|nr:SDR family oxidoreductase [SAR324 cluster bacterium]
MTDFHKPLDLFNVKGRSAVVTGATGALGRTATLLLANMGANLSIAAGSESDLEEVADEARKAGAEVLTVNRRPEKISDAEAIVAAAVDRFGGVDVLIVASGTNIPKMIDEMPTEEWEDVMDANVRGSWLMCKAAGPRMISQGRGGKVVLISSVRGRHGSPLGYSAYCTSKAAVDGLTRSLALEWGKHKINVNAIGPTVFRSKLTAWLFDDEKTGGPANVPALKRIPLGRLGEPEDLSGILAFLVSPASDFCTGQVIYVDGGYSAG